MIKLAKVLNKIQTLKKSNINIHILIGDIKQFQGPNREPNEQNSY